jgi:hypothetical protein
MRVALWPIFPVKHRDVHAAPKAEFRGRVKSARAAERCRTPTKQVRNGCGKPPQSKTKRVDKMLLTPLTIVLAVLSLGAQLVVFLRWMHRRIGDDEIQRAFIRDLALQHLPAIYRALHMMAEQQGITLDETPLVKYVDLRLGHRW